VTAYTVGARAYEPLDEYYGFDPDRLPPDADPYPAVSSVRPRFEVDEDGLCNLIFPGG